jgi:hypothetical protein
MVLPQLIATSALPRRAHGELAGSQRSMHQSSLAVDSNPDDVPHEALQVARHEVDILQVRRPLEPVMETGPHRCFETQIGVMCCGTTSILRTVPVSVRSARTSAVSQRPPPVTVRAAAGDPMVTGNGVPAQILNLYKFWPAWHD